MKSLKFYVAIAAIVLTTVSCVENSQKFKTLQAERDSLQVKSQMLTSEYNQTLSIMNEVDSGFAVINENGNQMRVNLKGVEGNSTSKREQIAAQMNSIKEMIEQNKTKIAELQHLSSKKGKQNKTLAKTIERLQNELTEKTTLIQSLQDELNQKNIKIEELTTTVTGQSKNIAEQQNSLEQQKSTIKVQDTELNTVWYCVASTKKLKEANILSGTGLFQTKKVMDKEFNQSVFTQTDLRSISSIPTGSKKIKILSSHPINSYRLITGDSETISIEITNPLKFWSVSKYLVVQI